MFGIVGALLCGIVAFGTASVARADVGALLPIVAEPGVPDEARNEALEAVLGYFARLPDAIPITKPEDGLRRAGARFRECGEPACASDYARALGIDLAVVVRLFAPDADAPHGGLSAALVTDEGVPYTGNVPTDERGMADAAVRALGLAYERWRRGPGPWLSIDGPDASRVRIDDGPLAALPYTEKHKPGLHSVRVENERGELLYSAAVRLPDDPAHHERLRVDADAAPIAAGPRAHPETALPEPAPAPTSQPSYWQRERSAWNYIIGVPLVLSGLFYTAVGIAHYSERGDCVEDVGGQCLRRKTVAGRSHAALGLGLTGVTVGAGAFLGAGIVREREQGPSSAMLHLRGRF